MSDVSNFFVEQEPDSSVQIFNYTSVINEIREEDPDVTYKRQYRKKYVLSDNNELLAAMNFFLGSPNNYIYFGLYNLRTQKKLYSHFRKWVGNNGRVRDVCFTKDSKTMYMVT